MEHFVVYKLRTPKRLLLQKLLVAQLVKKLSASLETQMFITECKRTVDLCFFLSQLNSDCHFNPTLHLRLGPVPTALATEGSYASLPYLPRVPYIYSLVSAL